MRVFLMLLVLGAMSVTARAGEICCDPVITYTNGMRLASSCPERSHNAYWHCDPYHVGQCGNRYNWPPLNSLLGIRPHAGPCTGEDAPSGLTIEAVSYAPPLEPSFERIGTLPPPATTER